MKKPAPLSPKGPAFWIGSGSLLPDACDTTCEMGGFSLVVCMNISVSKLNGF